VTDPHQPAEPQPGDALPQQGGELPRRKPGGGSQPQPGGSFFERAEPLQPSAAEPSFSNGLPQRRSVWEPLSPDGDRQQHESVFQEPDADSLPRRDGLPQRGQALPQRDRNKGVER